MSKFYKKDNPVDRPVLAAEPPIEMRGEVGPPSQDFFGGKKMTPYMAGTAIGKMTGIGTTGTALGKMSGPEQVPAMAEPSDPGYDREDEIVG